jgi:aminoglycoside phosphotransferase (APT) family kinase protein
VHDDAEVTALNIQELLDRVTLEADASWPGASVRDLEPLHGGVSSLTFAARLAQSNGSARRVVLKVAPPGLPAVRNRDVLRQARLLRALHGAPGVSVPEVLLEDACDPPLFVMSFVEGEAYEPKKDVSPSPPTPDIVDARARAAARMLAHLQQIEPAAVGLGDEPPIALVDELERWARLFATAGDDLRHHETVLHGQLAASVPASTPPRILHGDYRLGNMQFDGVRLAALIDWEIWSVGDPRTDLAWLLTYTDPVQRFVEERDPPNQAAADAMPHRDELLGEYLAIMPVELHDLDWFYAYCYYKIASTTAVLAKQNRRREEPDPGLEVAASTLAAVIDRGLEILEMAGSRR